MTAKIKLPPGFYKNGTDYSSAGRWLDGDLIRWHNKAILPVGGWTRRYDIGLNQDVAPLWGDGNATEASRSGIVLGDETLGINVFIGTNKEIYSVSNTNSVATVTPAGFADQPKNTEFDVGYGTYRYSFGQYGTPRPAPQGRIPNVFTWGFAEWGFWPIACAREMTYEPLYIKRETDTLFVPIVNSPLGFHDVVVTDERMVMGIGKTDDYRIVQWSDQENFEQWTPAIDNQAGSYRLSGTGKLVCGVKILNQVLILGENDAFSGQYLGPPYVYGFQRVGDRCGIIGPEAVAVTETFAVWIGALAFWIFDGTVRQLPCDVLDFYLEDKNVNQRSKTNAFTIADYSEVWWLYQSKNSVTKDVDSYIVYNYALNAWYTGRLDRTQGMDGDPMTYPFMVDTDGRMWDHEVPSAGRSDRTPYITSGPLEQANGDRLMGIAYVYPDADNLGDVNMRLDVRDMPQAPVRYSKEFILTDPTSTTGIMGRDIRMTLYGTKVSPNWRVGDFRVVPTKISGPMA